MRVLEVARELDIAAEVAVIRLREENFPVRSHMSEVPEEGIARLRTVIQAERNAGRELRAFVTGSVQRRQRKRGSAETDESGAGRMVEAGPDAPQGSEVVPALRVRSDAEVVLAISKELEQRLRQDYRAAGRGLGELATSIANKLPILVRIGIQRLATIRNKFVHEERSQFPILVRGESIGRQDFEALFAEIKEALRWYETVHLQHEELERMRLLQATAMESIAGAHGVLNETEQRMGALQQELNRLRFRTPE